MSKTTGDNIRADHFNIFEGFTANESIAADDALSLRSDFTIAKASASAYASERMNFIGFALEAASIGSTVKIDIGRCVTLPSGSFTPHNILYLSDTNGELSTTPGTVERRVGMALAATKLIRFYGAVSPIFNYLSNTSTDTFTTYAPTLFFPSAAGGVTSEYIKYGGPEAQQEGDTPAAIIPAHDTVTFAISSDDIEIQLYDFGSIL